MLSFKMETMCPHTQIYFAKMRFVNLVPFSAFYWLNVFCNTLLQYLPRLYVVCEFLDSLSVFHLM